MVLRSLFPFQIELLADFVQQFVFGAFFYYHVFHFYVGRFSHSFVFMAAQAGGADDFDFVFEFGGQVLFHLCQLMSSCYVTVCSYTNSYL